MSNINKALENAIVDALRWQLEIKHLQSTLSAMSAKRYIIGKGVTEAVHTLIDQYLLFENLAWRDAFMLGLGSSAEERIRLRDLAEQHILRSGNTSGIKRDIMYLLNPNRNFLQVTRIQDEDQLREDLRRWLRGEEIDDEDIQDQQESETDEEEGDDGWEVQDPSCSS